MDFDDLVKKLAPPLNRRGRAPGDVEHHLYEGAVMVAYAMHLLRDRHASRVEIHPDGEHGKQFDFSGWLGRQGFSLVSRSGTTSYGGTYTDASNREVIVSPKSGLGDVVARVDGLIVSAECKGGIINTKHAGQLSRLRKGLCETVGLLMSSPNPGRQVAVVPHTDLTLRLATRMSSRCALAGIEIALVGSRGEVVEVKA